MPDAETRYRTVIQAAQNLSVEKDPGLVLEARARLAALFVRTHRDAEAEREFRLALALINTTRSELGRAEYRISYFSTLLGVYQDYVEISNIHRQFAQAVVRTGADAQPEAYAASNPGRFSIIHFAAHAEANRDDPLDSAIILSPHGDSYKLYARGVMGLPIQASLVTISACRSAAGRTYAGEGPVGFAWAFLQAGARNVVAGLWEVDDRSTAELMDRMYTELRRGQSPQRALRTAKLALCRSQGPFRKPYYWALVQVITDSLAR